MIGAHKTHGAHDAPPGSGISDERRAVAIEVCKPQWWRVCGQSNRQSRARVTATVVSLRITTMLELGWR